MTIDLQPFCLDEDSIRHWDVHKPWIKGNWKYATDLAIVVRVPSDIPGIATSPNVPSAPFMFKDFDPDECTELLPEWDGSMYEYQEECHRSRCHDGKISGGQNDCPTCHGKGTIPESIETTITFQGFHFHGGYLQDIHTLGGAKGCVKDVTLPGNTPTGQLNFIFDGGGQGLLMNTSSVVTKKGII